MENNDIRSYLVVANPVSESWKVMANDVLKTFVEQYLEVTDKNLIVEFFWSGIEPTYAGVEFYKNVFFLQEKYGKRRKIVNTIKTSGEFLNDEWCQFLSENKFMVTVKLDGPKVIHNHFQKDRNGGGTFDATMNAIGLLKFYKIKYDTITTINDVNVKLPKLIYKFISKHSSDINFQTNIRDSKISGREFGEFICEILDEWYEKDREKINVQLFEATLNNLEGRYAGICKYERYCGKKLAIDANGNVYSCKMYMDERFLLGNILEDNLEDMIKNNKNFGNKKLGDLSTECMSCCYFELCYGGCPFDRKASAESDNNNYLCEGYKMFYKRFSELFREEENSVWNRVLR